MGTDKAPTTTNQFPINVNSKRIGKKSRDEILFDNTKFKRLEKAQKTSQTAVAKAMGLAKAQFGDRKRRSTIESTPMQ